MNIIANVKYINQRIKTNQEDQIKELIDVTKFYKSIHANILGISDPLSKEERIIFSNWMDDVFNNKEIFQHITKINEKKSSDIAENDMNILQQLYKKIYKSPIGAILKKLGFDITIFKDYAIMKQHKEKLKILVPDLNNLKKYKATVLNMTMKYRMKKSLDTYKEYKANDELNKIDNPKYISVNDKITMIKIMTELNAQIESSWTADEENHDDYSTGQKFIDLESEYLKNNIYHDEFTNILGDKITTNQPSSRDILLLILHKNYHIKRSMCACLATHMAIKLRENFPHLTDQIHTCKIWGHAMCCIGDLNNPNSIIIDPWIRYLNLQGQVQYSHENTKMYYRDNQVRYDTQERKRGYCGTVKDYKQFLKDHPNIYVPKNADLDMTINNTSNDVSRQITSADIEAPKLPQNTIIALKQILKDNNIKI